ncbi:hypothetical protein MYSTI_00887 [Myxococcus stipitatus DSM 14675]|uniref:Lipoprotein n=1 Tax=Myxococcus stipitatus (strain DSM 14675 / JCM 12634 / Mx s8) TaxID=1278073 RepID=L7U0B6_MYXSD|nr:MopE-related protein [Myxococcus stipitatus]AGC42236.1 hypothetical protein MYSTI_00887 [Myxococcus stipitatus DSM 14675]
MKTFNAWLCALCSLVLVSGSVGCSVEFPNDAPYTCDLDGDCGGDGYVCTSLPNNGPKYCCLPEPVEKCNNVDDDCDGLIDEMEGTCFTGPAEARGKGVCRDGQPVCRQGGEACINEVTPSTETCNRLDDDCDGQVDEDFNLMTDRLNCGTCGTRCNTQQDCVEGVCQRRPESNCADGLDDDGDFLVDCEDRIDCPDTTACTRRVGGNRVPGTCQAGVCS